MSSTVSMLTRPSLPSKYCERPHNPCPSRNMSSICLPCMYLSNTGESKPNIKCICALDNKLCGMCKEYMKNKMFPPGDRLSLLKPYEPNTTYALVTNYNQSKQSETIGQMMMKSYLSPRCEQCEAQTQNPNDYAMGVHSRNCPFNFRSRRDHIIVPPPTFISYNQSNVRHELTKAWETPVIDPKTGEKLWIE